MYNLLKAKEEIDTVAKHTTDLATHVLAMGDNLEHKLEDLKKELLNAISTRFAELERTIVGGENSNVETSAISDLGAKIATLVHGTDPSPTHDAGAHSDTGYAHANDHGQSGYHDDHHGHHDHG